MCYRNLVFLCYRNLGILSLNFIDILLSFTNNWLLNLNGKSYNDQIKGLSKINWYIASEHMYSQQLQWTSLLHRLTPMVILPLIIQYTFQDLSFSFLFSLNCWFIVDSTQYKWFLNLPSLIVGKFNKPPSIRRDSFFLYWI